MTTILSSERVEELLSRLAKLRTKHQEIGKYIESLRAESNSSNDTKIIEDFDEQLNDNEKNQETLVQFAPRDERFQEILTTLEDEAERIQEEVLAYASTGSTSPID